MARASVLLKRQQVSQRPLRIVFLANKALPFHAVARYDIYQDLLASARFFGLAADTQFDQFAEMVANVNSLVVYRSVYAAINGLK